MKIEAALTYDRIRYDQAKAAHLVISVTAPAKEGTTYATDVVLELNALAGHRIENVISGVDADEQDGGGEVTMRIPGILAEERRDIVLAVKLKAQKKALPRAVNVFDVKLTFDTVSPDGKKEKKTVEAKAKAQFVKPGRESPTPNEALDKIMILAEMSHAQMAAQAQPRKGDLRRKVLLDLKAALVRADDGEAVRLARQLVGLSGMAMPPQTCRHRFGVSS
jgi:hypothetical protein